MEIGAKAAQKMLIKLTTDESNQVMDIEDEKRYFLSFFPFDFNKISLYIEL